MLDFQRRECTKCADLFYKLLRFSFFHADFKRLYNFPFGVFFIENDNLC